RKWREALSRCSRGRGLDALADGQPLRLYDTPQGYSVLGRARGGSEDSGMSGGAAGRRGSARLVAACVLLLGLFLMHGAPATAAEGCHGAMPSVAAAMHDGH